MVRFQVNKRRAAAILAAAGWSRRALAERLGLHHGTVSRWLSGQHGIPSGYLDRIAEIVEVKKELFLDTGAWR